MKKIIIVTILLMFFSVGIAIAQVHVDGYWRDTNRDGIKDTYIQPHERSSPNSSRQDNYSYPGSYNPNSGRVNPPSDSQRELYPSNPNPYKSRSRY